MSLGSVSPVRYLQGRAIRALPVTARWLINGVPLTFNFSRVQAPLQPIQPTDVGGVVDPDWAGLLLFGEYYLEGGANPLLAVEVSTGAVRGLDIERPSDSILFFNSTVEQFASTFFVFDRALRLRELGLDLLAPSAAEIDPDGFRGSEWDLLADGLSLSEED